MTIQITKIGYFLLAITILLMGYFYFSFQKIKKAELERLKILSNEIDTEKNIEYQLKDTSKKIQRLNKSTQFKLLQIKIDIFNINFTLSEIL